MWISKIELSNFKVYQKADFNFGQPEVGRNMVLIGALNGHGKTSLLEAIYIGLYGKDALGFLERAGIQTERIGWAGWLNDALYKGIHDIDQNKRGRYVQMKTCIEINESKNSAIRIERIFTFNKNTLRFEEEQTHFFQKNAGAAFQIVQPDKQPSIMANRGVPCGVARLFFFDAEKIADQMSKDQQAFIRSALHSLAGIDLFDALQTDLEKHAARTIILAGNQSSQDDLEKKQAEIEQKRAALAKLQEQQAVEQAQIEALDKKNGNLLSDLFQLAGGDTKSSKEYINLQKEAEKSQDNIKENINKCLGDSLAQSLIPQQLLQSLQSRLAPENALIHHESGKKQASHRFPEFMQKLREHEGVKEEIGKAILTNTILEAAISSVWDSLFYPLPDNCAKKIWHNYLNSDGHATLRGQMDTWGQGLPNIPHLLEEQQKAQALFALASNALLRLDNTNAEELRTQMDEIKKARAQHQLHLDGINKTIEQDSPVLKTAEETYTQMKEAMFRAEPALLEAKRADQLKKCIQKIKASFLDTLQQEISDKTSQLYRRIAHDQQVSTIKLDADGKIEALDQQGQTISLGLSAGERQIQIQALFGGLAQAADYGAPMVIDTPLGRLDQTHRENLFGYWTGLPQQVILLAQDAEITEENFKRLQPHVNTLYSITTEQFGQQNGYKRSEIKSGQFFNY